MHLDGRAPDELRPVKITPGYSGRHKFEELKPESQRLCYAAIEFPAALLLAARQDTSERTD